MTETAWTPGPWEAEASCDEDGDPYWSDDLNAAVWCVATPYTADTATWLVDAVREADARLIAAAPDLYDALYDLVASFDEGSTSYLLERCRAALARAARSETI